MPVSQAVLTNRIGPARVRPTELMSHNGPIPEADPPPSTGSRRTSFHEPVLVNEVLGQLVLVEDGVYVDGTTGEGGHSKAILDAAPQARMVLGIDLDPRSLDAAAARLTDFGTRFRPVAGNYADMVALAAQEGINSVDGVLLDLGFSSRQVEVDTYGLSFQIAGPLDMRYDPDSDVDADYIVNTYEERELGQLLRRYGEEPRGMAIARAVARNRPIGTTTELAALVEKTIGRRPGSRVHPATRTFQALRIAVNDELGNVQRGLEAALELLAPGGRLAVIGYHSLEDRIVKSFLVNEAAECICPPHLPVCVCHHVARVRIINRRVIKPTTDEVDSNPRSRSARLRVAQRL